MKILPGSFGGMAFGACLLALLGSPVCRAQVQQGFTSFHEGNSLTDPMTVAPAGTMSPILLLETAFGDASPKLSTNVVAGTPIDWVWANQKAGFVTKLAEPPAPFRAIVVQPFRHQGGTNPRSEAAAAAQLYREALKTSGSADLYLYFTWEAGSAARSTDGAYDWETWRTKMQADLSNYQYPLLNILRQEFPGRKVYVIPVTQAFVRLYDELKLKSDVGFTTMNDAFDTGGASVHPHRKVYYMSAVTHAASFCKTSPVGKGLPYDIDMVRYWDPQADWTQKTGLTAAQANNLQTYAWDAIMKSPGTVMNYAISLSDTVKPGAFTTGSTVLLNAQAATVNWQPATDNTGVTAYSIYLNDELLIDPIVPGSETSFSKVITFLQPGTTNKVKVRAWDAAFNYSEKVLDVATPAQSSNVLVGYDCLGINSKSAVTALEPKTVEPDITATALQGGPGVKFVPDQYVGNRFQLAGVSGTTLAQAIVNQEYLTFKMTVAPGKQVALDSITLAVNSGKDSGFALFSTATGLPAAETDANLAQGEYTFPAGDQDFEFPLRSLPSMEAVSGEMEFRVYFWNHPDRLGRGVDGPGSYELSVRGAVSNARK